MNEDFKKIVKTGGHISHDISDDGNQFKQLCERVLQSYMREARRTVDIKIFKCKIWREKDN